MLIDRMIGLRQPRPVWKRFSRNPLEGVGVWRGIVELSAVTPGAERKRGDAESLPRRALVHIEYMS